jgi:hypothetical protein
MGTYKASSNINIQKSYFIQTSAPLYLGLSLTTNNISAGQSSNGWYLSNKFIPLLSVTILYPLVLTSFSLGDLENRKTNLVYLCTIHDLGFVTTCAEIL